MLRISRWPSLPAFPALLLACLPADAGWLILCDSKTNTVEGRRYLSPDGRDKTLLVADSPIAGCAQLEIPVPADAVHWTGLIPRDTAMRLDAGVSLLTRDTTDGLLVSEVIPAKPAPAPLHARPPMLLLGSNTLPRLDLQVFGNPARAQVRRTSGGLALTCAAGANVAGLLVTARHAMLPVGANLQIAVRYSATADFSVAFANAEGLTRQTPMRLGPLVANRTGASVAFPLPPITTAEPHGFSLRCPGSDASLQLRSLELRAAGSRENTRRATWVWQGDVALAEPAALLRELLANDIRTLFLAVPLTGEPPAVADTDALAALIERAREHHIETWAVEGDPAAVTHQGREHFLRRTRALAAFNAGQPEQRRLHGVQYDIEPYLLGGFELAREAWLREYLETLGALRNAWSLPMEVAVPFWWSGLTVDGMPLLAAMHPFVDGLTVMNYRSDPEQLQRLAAPFLAWGVRQQRYVRIALESVALPDQSLAHFRRGRSGRLWQLRLGQTDVLVLLAAPGHNPAGETFSRAYVTDVPAGRTTFHGRPGQLAEHLPALVRHWSAWPSFTGAALHGYLKSFP